jgi:hypothetical protein
VRGYQVMLDRDLAPLYQTDTRTLKQAVKRNIEKFPDDFLFILNESEITLMVSQFVIPSKQILGGAAPFAFTEQGVAMLAGVLKSDIAVKISIRVIRAFIEMRKFIQTNAQVFQRLDRVEVKLLENDQKFDKLFNAAYNFVSDLFRRAQKSILIIDNYIDDTVLLHLTAVLKGVKVKILTKSISDKLALDIQKFSQQYFHIEAKVFTLAHDRFVIIDDKDVYHFGASLKDLGKKWFAFSKIEKSDLELLSKLEKY